MPGYLLAAVIVRDIYAAESLQGLGDHHSRDRQSLVGRHALFCRNGNGNNAVHFSLTQLGEDVSFLFQTAVGVADNDAVPLVKRLILYGFNNFTEKRVGNFRNQQADDVRPVSRQALGNEVVRLYDVGVAGLHRLLAHLDEIMQAEVIIAIAGMEGALASVIGGLADCPVIAVPTSVGYGASFFGLSALLSMLNSCASGVSVVNIDNGFGAGYLASMINHKH